MSATTWREWASVAWHLFRRRPLPPSIAPRTQGEHVVVDLAEPRIYELDGEDRPAADHLEFTVEPAAISIKHKGLDHD